MSRLVAILAGACALALIAAAACAGAPARGAAAEAVPWSTVIARTGLSQLRSAMRADRRVVVRAPRRAPAPRPDGHEHSPAQPAPPPAVGPRAPATSRQPIAFAVRDLNRTGIACRAGGGSDTVLGTLVTPGGARTVALLLHGLGQTAAYWSDVQTGLARRGIASVAITRLGYGRGVSPVGECLGAQADMAAQIAEALRRRFARVALVGHSAGGLIAETAAWAFAPADALAIVSYADSPSPLADPYPSLVASREVNLLHLDRVRVPVLLAWGDEDQVWRPRAFADAARRFGGPVASLRYPGLDHGLPRARSSLADDLGAWLLALEIGAARAASRGSLTAPLALPAGP